jgi:hypothetical protein
MSMSHCVLIGWNFLARVWSSTALWTLVGVFVGAWLSRAWQRKQWVLDNRKAEYRELISGLRECAHEILKNPDSTGASDRLNRSDEVPDVDGPEARGYNLISDRLFIADVMIREKVRQRWLAVVGQQANDTKFRAEWSTLYRLLVKTARLDLKLPDVSVPFLSQPRN